MVQYTPSAYLQMPNNEKISTKIKHSSKVEFTKCKVELIINNKLLGIYGNRGASVENVPTSNDTFGGIHSNGSDNAFTQMMRHLQHKPRQVI